MSEDSIFSKIIRGEIPANRVYEDDHVIAILDINPLSEGHTLVIPKEPSATIDELSDDASAAVGRVLPRVSRAIKKATGARALNVLQNNGREAGQEVDHVHFHVIPCYPDREDGGLRKNWTPGKLDAEKGADLGRKIARLL